MIHQLNHRLSQSDIHELCALTQGGRNNSLKEQLYQLTLDDDRRVAPMRFGRLPISQWQTTSGFTPSTTSLLTVV